MMSVTTRSNTTKSLSLKAGFLLAAFAATPAMAELDELRLGVPPWPGVTVKSEIAAQLLESMGYETRQQDLAVSVILEGLARNDLEIYLGGWYPVQTDMVEPLVADGKVEKVVSNISGANSGLVVPQYVYDAGVTTVAELAEHHDRFDGEIHGSVVTDLEMQEFEISQTAPVASVKSIATDHVQGSTYKAPFNFGHDQQHVFSHGFPQVGEKIPVQIGLSPFFIRSILIKRIKGIPMALFNLIAAQGLNDDVLFSNGAAFLANSLTLA